MPEAMHALARLAGWATVPDAGDHAVVRLALSTARDRHDPNRGGDPELAAEVARLEALWLEEIL